ncbi:MAG TPA: protein kinase [Chthoniobacterales bacterium]|jgi:serine/threonine protein kinase/Tfp pilus assembly protein PilF|nr:protein kinase [Chthoniobacterales bacterium]
MNQERWHRLKSIVADALEENSPAARTALLQRECAEDVALLREAESFLTAADTISAEGTDRLEECAAAAARAVRRERLSLTGHRIGAYIIVRELGHGGMATVYLAARADGYFEKEVAIKILKPVGGNTTELLDRFRAEREVLASLDHPNIAALFDAGTTPDGLPYFVMEYVPGMPVTSYVAEHHLTIPQRLALFLKICAAVEVAHRKRVVHRDLKRNNILVNAEGEPKLLDFGIAKLLEENPLAVTTTGQQRLTPISASPEQARGDEVTRASDIYALGALLYELLTGHAPHRFQSRHPGMDEVTRVVCEQEPILPSVAADHPEVRHALRGDLDAIVQRAMRKDPAERYASVADLETDIRHYLAGEPVQARPNTLPYRLLRFAGRQKSLAGRLALAALVIALAVLGIFALIDRRTEPVAPAPQAKPETQILLKSIAVLPFDDFDAPTGTSYFADGVQDDILTDLAKAGDLKVISRSGVSQYRTGARDVREIRQDLGVAYVLEGSVRKSTDHLRVNVQLIDTESDVQVWAEQYDRKLEDIFALQSDLSQAVVAQLKGKLSAREKAAIESRPTADVQAYDLYLHARELFVEYKYPEAVDLLEQAVARDPKFALAYCLLANVNLYIYRYGEDMSPARLERARVAAETALRLAPDLPESHLAQAQYYYNGLRDYEKAQAELASAPASPAGRAKFFDLTALTERRLGHWKEALRSGEKAWEIDPHDPFVATELIQTYQFLRRNTEAEKKADQAIRNIPNRAGPFRAVKADCIISQGDLARAQVFLETIPDEAEQKHVTLARTAFYQRDFAKALLDIEAARKAEMRPPYSFLDLMDGSIARAQGDTEKSKQMFEKARETLEASLEKRPNDAPAIVNLAWAYAGLGQKEEALRASQQAVQLVPSWRDAVEGPGYAAMQAMVQAWVGNKEAAIEQLTALMKQAGSPSYGELKFDPDWDDLRQDPRFAELIAEAAKPIKIE